MKKKNIAVIFGGKSGEHEVSISSARGIIKNLDNKKYNIIPVAILKTGEWLTHQAAQEYLISDIKSYNGEKKKISWNGFSDFVRDSHKIDFVFPITHGSFGEDGKLQGLLDMLGLPYLFSGCLASAVAMDKSKTKIILKNAGVPVLEDVIINKQEEINLNKIIKKLNFPIVVKPLELGSSVGISIAKTKKDLKTGINKAFQYGERVMLEKFARGKEFTVSVMGRKELVALSIIEIIPKISEFYDYKAKYKTGGSKHVCPARISKKIKSELEKYAIKAFREIGCRDLARADFIIEEESGKIYFIEINTIPGMTSTSLAPEAAREVGMDFGNFLDKLINKYEIQTRRKKNKK
ncbi:MAG: D-alanine--D-alanine ligase family protein [bacterium]